MSDRKPILIIRAFPEPLEPAGRTRLIALVETGRIEVVGVVDKVGDTVNSPLEISIWDKFVLDQLDSTHLRPKFGGVANPKQHPDGPVATLQFDQIN